MQSVSRIAIRPFPLRETWRGSSVGQSMRLISAVSGVQFPPSLPENKTPVYAGVFSFVRELRSACASAQTVATATAWTASWVPPRPGRIFLTADTRRCRVLNSWPGCPCQVGKTNYLFVGSLRSLKWGRTGFDGDSRCRGCRSRRRWPRKKRQALKCQRLRIRSGCLITRHDSSDRRPIRL